MRTSKPAAAGEALTTTASAKQAPWHVTALAAAAHAALLVLSFEPVGLWFAAPLSVAAFGWCVMGARSTRLALVAVFVAQLASWLWLHQWLTQMTKLGWPAVAIYMAAYGVAIAWLVRRVMAHHWFARWPLSLVLPVVWVGLECLRGELAFDGYNWFLLGHAMAASTLLMQSADLFGTYFLSFLVAAAGGAMVDGFRRVTAGVSMRDARWAIGGALLAVICVVAYGYIRLGQAEHQRILAKSDAREFRVLAIQTNLPQSNKMAWLPPDQVNDFAEFYRQTVEAVDAVTSGGDRPLSLIIWPETMVPGYGLEPQAIALTKERDLYPSDSYLVSLKRLRELTGVPLLVGSPSYFGLRISDADRTYSWDVHHNSAYLIDGEAPFQRSDKVFLTPFGERMPYIEHWPWLEQKLLGLGATGMTFSLDAADEPTILIVPYGWEDPGAGPRASTVRLAVPICFEATVGSVCRRMVYAGGEKRADVLVNLSNDGWFGWSEPGRAQHAQMARLRCVENRVPLVRCANTGLSIAYDSAGNVIGTIGEGRYGTGQAPGALPVTLPLDPRTTLYSRVGDLWAWMCLAATGVLLALTWRRRKPGIGASG